MACFPALQSNSWRTVYSLQQDLDVAMKESGIVIDDDNDGDDCHDGH